jgi:hypothetical protein
MATGVFENEQQLIQEVGAWNKRKLDRMKMNIASLTSKGKGQLLAALRGSRIIKGGTIEGTGFKFLRHGVFLQKGVGRGNPIGNSRRKPKDWFNKEIENIDDLANMVAQYRADTAIKAFKIQ